MKKLMMITLMTCSLILNSCTKEDTCSRGSVYAPYGTPDSESNYDSGDIKTITYTYYCHNGQYVSITYISENNCTKWHKQSEYKSTGICNK